LEKNIHRLIEESAILMEKRKFFLSLEKAKEAVKRDNALQKHMESHSLLQDQLGDLTYTVWFHLALVYETNRMYQESIEAYSFLLRQKMSLVYVGRIRANMGNIFFCQQNYTEAVKMYRMALDQTPRENVGLIQNIYRSIANSFFRLGKLRDAIRNYEAASNSSADIKTYFNLLLCCVKVGDNKKSKEMLQKIMTTISSSVKSQSTLLSLEEEKTSAEPDLRFELDKERKDEESLVVIAARLLSTLFVGEELVELFRWILEILGDNCDGIVVQIEIEQAIQHLGRNEFFTAINILKCYESSDDNTNDAISTNLSFIYFLQGNYDAAEESANVALSLNRYNHNALVNKGNCCFVQKDFTRAQNFYLEAMKVDCNSIEAIYNLGIASIRLNLIEDAREAFDKLHSILPHDPRVLYQIASLHEVKKELKLSKKWFNVLSTSISTDANVLSRLGQIYCEEDDESQSVHFYLESYRCYPSNLDTIGWLAVWFVKNGMYEKSIQFFEYASRIQPNIHKWHLMIASCYRKTGKDKKAISIYEKIHADDPENLECKKILQT
jgi:intraflagellar transport protein 88